ncbi:PrgI family protein [Catenulispora pinisilvae]|uniref:PrgI family protein n=1 Tax=Catenulispora pinisilvae TaxID=2705253 RepID=UPI001891F8BC|nr:PrgI family protein [Catenulispora pinisilvae]
MSEDRHGYTVRIPQNLSAPDKIVFGATARQCLILGGAAVGLWLTWLAVHELVPPLLFAAAAGLLLLLLGIAVTAERDGIGLDRLLTAALRQRLTPRRRVMAPEGISTPPTFLNEALRGQNLPPVAPLDLPVQGVGDGGVVDLGPNGAAAIGACSTVNFGLRTPAEQELLVGGFSRWLNSLTGPVQITSRTTCADLNAQVTALRTSAASLAHPLLEAAALDHADFLTRVDDSGAVLHRNLLITAREPDPAHTPRAVRRITDAAAALSAAEIHVAPQDTRNAHAVLNTALDPETYR